MEQLYSFPAEQLDQDVVYVSIAMELQASTLTNDKDRIQFGNLVNEARHKLEDSDLEEKTKLLEQLDVVMNHQDELVQFIGGLTVYITPDDVYFYHLAIPVKERVQIGKLPYVLPLLVNYQFTREYHLLVLDRESIRMFEGHGDRIEEIDLSNYEDAPVDITTALGTEEDDRDVTHGSFSGGFRQGGAPDRGAQKAYHSHDDISEERDIDRERYFQRVDEFVYSHFTDKKKVPLILYSVEENQAVFRAVSDNEQLADTSLHGSATNLQTSDIQEKVAETIDELIGREREELFEELNETSPQNRIENIPDDLASASLQGRIEKLYLESDYEVNGSMSDDGRYDENSDANDFIERLIQNVLSTKGEVYILDTDELPLDTPIAARLRY